MATFRRGQPSRAAVRRRNPVPASSVQEQLSQAQIAFTRFTGMDPDDILRVKIPPMPKAAWTQGIVDAIEYSCYRDGKLEHYRHDFGEEWEECKPFLAVSPDGEYLYIIGGSYKVTEAGIEDLEPIVSGGA